MAKTHLPLHDIAHALIIHRVLAGVVQQHVKLERVILPHVVDNPHRRILFDITIDRPCFWTHDELIMSKVSSGSCSHRYPHGRPYHPEDSVPSDRPSQPPSISHDDVDQCFFGAVFAQKSFVDRQGCDGSRCHRLKHPLALPAARRIPTVTV